MSRRKQTRRGSGWRCAVRRDRWWPTRSEIAARPPVAGCGKPFPGRIVQVTASPIAGKRIRAVIPEDQQSAVGKDTGETAHVERWNTTTLATSGPFCPQNAVLLHIVVDAPDLPRPGSSALHPCVCAPPGARQVIALTCDVMPTCPAGGCLFPSDANARGKGAGVTCMTRVTSRHAHRLARRPPAHRER
jgi:hypothetical protein